MAISNLLDIDSISDRPISNLVMSDPSRRALPPGMPLSRTSDLGNAVLASTRGSTRLGKCSSLSFADSYLTSIHAFSGTDVPFSVCHFLLSNVV
jgi:hypothetical protein